MIQRKVIRTLTPEEMGLLQPELQAIAAGEAAKGALGRYLQLLAGRADAVFDLGTCELYIPVESAPPAPEPPMGEHGVASTAAVHEDDGN